MWPVPDSPALGAMQRKPTINLPARDPISVANGLARHPSPPVLVVSNVESLGLLAAEHALVDGWLQLTEFL